MKKLITLLLVLTGMVTTASADEWFLKGGFNGWGETNPFDEGTTTVSLTAGQTYEFKVWNKTTNKYYGNTGTMTWKSSSEWDFWDDNGNCNITAATTGLYTFSFSFKANNNIMVTVAYPAVGTIYFHNTLGWTQPYFYILDGDKWGGKGVSLTGFYNGIAMEQIGSSDVWKADYPINASHVVFLKEKQNNYENIWNTEAVWRTDFNSSAPVFVPKTTSSNEVNSTKYFSNGEWRSYSAPSDTYTRENLTVGNFGTICLPYTAIITGATVYTIKNKLMSGDALLGINLEPVEALVAGKPYIFKATEATLTATYSGNYNSAIAANGMMGNLTGEAIKVPADVHYYVIGGNEIHEVVSENNSSNVTVGQYKAYITLEGIKAVYSSSSREDNFIAFENGEATGISQIENGELNNENCFDLQGRRVAQPTKGLYIMNGKKVIIK